MGYTTKFFGQFQLDKPLTKAQVEYLQAFSITRHMKRNVEMLKNEPNPLLLAVNLPLGVEGEFYVGSVDDFKHYIRDYPPSSQPSTYCQWVPTDDGKFIKWNGWDKFYDYTEWIRYIIASFLSPWGYKLNGTVKYRGERSNDQGVLIIINNKVKKKRNMTKNERRDAYHWFLDTWRRQRVVTRFENVPVTTITSST